MKTVIPEDIWGLYEIHNYRNATQCSLTGCSEIFEEIIEALRVFRLTLSDILKPGGKLAASDTPHPSDVRCHR